MHVRRRDAAGVLERVDPVGAQLRATEAHELLPQDEGQGERGAEEGREEQRINGPRGMTWRCKTEKKTRKRQVRQELRSLPLL
jgi:hypothetical protein